LHKFEFIGELALDGQVRKVAGVLPTALSCADEGRELIVPSTNSDEAGLADATNSWQASHLLDVCRHLTGEEELRTCKASVISRDVDIYPDLCDVKGQKLAKRALEIAASGGHSLLFIGPPGAGKSMLAMRLPGILPELNTQEALEAAAIRSVARGDFDISRWKQRPFRNPHHSASAVALVGGGSHPRPGEISLAHKGILFLDELTEFSRATLEQLREPLETGQINIARANQSAQYPAEFMLIAACNPCPCGYANDGTERCSCSVGKIESYRSKLSGPMLDRIDMHVHLARVTTRELQSSDSDGEQSATVKSRVQRTQSSQLARQKILNSRLQGKSLDLHCALDHEIRQFMELAGERLQLSARAYHRILKLARTIADMEQVDVIQKKHVSEAISFRSLDRR
jgi:magnesium chelatase family protein